MLEWKTTIVRPIFKKRDKFEFSHYRPVGLTSLVKKVMEAIIYDQVMKSLLDHHLVPDEQHGFLPGRSIKKNSFAVGQKIFILNQH